MNITEIRAELKKLEVLEMGPERWGKRLELEKAVLRRPEYYEYYKLVVEEGVKRYGEGARSFWEQWSYESEFLDDVSAEECIDAQIEAME